jgi:signal transduction histidine kinase
MIAPLVNYNFLCVGNLSLLVAHPIDLEMLFPQSIIKSLQRLEWLFLIFSLGMMLSVDGYNLMQVLGSCSAFFVLSCFFPNERPLWQRWVYILVGIGTLMVSRSWGIDLGIFLSVYIAKSYFLLGARKTNWLIALILFPWLLSEYRGELHALQHPRVDLLGLNPTNPVRFFIFSAVLFMTATYFTIMVSSILVREQKNGAKIAELSGQVEVLAASLERTRIARDLHDSLGHTLTDLDTQLAVALTLRQQDPEKAYKAVDTAKYLSRQCIEDISQALGRIRESNFDLNQALLSLRQQLQQTPNLKVEWEVSLPTLPVYPSYQIYCIVKEALMNVQKHARASQVSFLASKTAFGIILELKDNGVGFNRKHTEPGFGLQGMIERVQVLGGQFDVQTTPGEGTQLYITLPL